MTCLVSSQSTESWDVTFSFPSPTWPLDNCPLACLVSAPRDQSAMQAYNEPIAADLPKEQRGKMLEERKGTAVR